MKILYKTVTPIFTALIFPVIVFMPFFRLITASDTVNQLLTKYGIGEQITLLDLYHAVSNIKTQAASDGKTLNLSLDVIPQQARGYLIAFLVFFALAVLCPHPAAFWAVNIAPSIRTGKATLYNVLLSAHFENLRIDGFNHLRQTQVHNKQPLWNANLRCCQTNAASIFQGFLHIVQQTAQGFVKLCYRFTHGT